MKYTHIYHNDKLANTSFLITGGAGFVGSHIAEYLLQHQAKRVVVVDNFLTGLRQNIDYLRQYERFEFIEADITDLAAMQKACEGIDVICNQAALGSVPRSVANPSATFRNNVEGFSTVVMAARDLGVKRIVFASSSSIYGVQKTNLHTETLTPAPISPYGFSKQSNEIMGNIFSQLYGIEYMGFRYFNVFGPRQSPKGVYAAVIPLFIEAFLQDKDLFINGKGEQSRDFTFVENVVQANVKAMLTDNPAAINQIYNIGCGGNFTVMELYQAIADLLPEFQKQATFRAAREGDIVFSKADISRARELLGYEPLFDFKTGLAQTVAFFKQYGSWGV